MIMRTRFALKYLSKKKETLTLEAIVDFELDVPHSEITYLNTDTRELFGAC